MKLSLLAGALALGLTVAPPALARKRGAVVEPAGVVATINAKLRRWVKPSGRCHAGETETLTTYYNSGRRTANGEPFNPRGHTAAHRKLAFGTWLRVRNPYNGRVVNVRINDRGPFTIAKLDLAEGAARRIDMRTSLYLCIS